MKSIKTLFVCLMALLVVSSALALPLTVEQVQLDDVDLDQNVDNTLDLERNQEYELEVLITPDEDLEDVEVEAKISGYEYNDVNPVYANSGVKDMDAGNTYKIKLKVSLPDDIQEDTYLLRLRISDRAGTHNDLLYQLKVDVPRHKLDVEDVLFYPGGNVVAGQALLTTVRLENNGEKDEKDVKVEVSMPELGLSAADYVDEIESDDEEETEEMFLRVPVCAKTGAYPVEVRVSYDNGHEHATAKTMVNVLASERCVEEVEKEDETKVVVQDNTEDKPEDTTETVPPKSNLRSALETVLLVLVGLLVVVGLIIGFSKLRSEEEEF